MSVDGPNYQDSHTTRADRERAVVNSALWAAAGDAIGWITELSRDRSGVAYRSGVEEVREPIEWERVIGGRGGPRVHMPAGTYSDDTQLRLAVCRSIRGDGAFDAETFAKIELPVWPTYALGGGLGTKAAAVNLAKRSVNWFSNFFESGGQSYIRGGGNGAAMRIQPHVWASAGSKPKMLLEVMRDSLITHGHPHGFCGAVFHALCLDHVLRTKTIPTPEEWTGFVREFAQLESLIDTDPQLATFWHSAWEESSRERLSSSIAAMQEQALADIGQVALILTNPPDDPYRAVLDRTGCLLSRYRGSGFKTALAAVSLAYMYAHSSPDTALARAANELESDTDTIATMVGALLGSIANGEPRWTIQDRNYIKSEALRLVSISFGETTDSFTYPDLSHWNPPTKQTASVGLFNQQLAIAGLGALQAIGSEYRAADAIWQWFSLPFGQTILAKRKATGDNKLSRSQLPGPRQGATAIHAISDDKQRPLQPSLPLPSTQATGTKRVDRADATLPAARREGVDDWTDIAIRSDFDDLVLGRMLNRCIDQSGSIENAIVFAGIIAKAKITRQRRRQ